MDDLPGRVRYYPTFWRIETLNFTFDEQRWRPPARSKGICCICSNNWKFENFSQISHWVNGLDDDVLATSLISSSHTFSNEREALLQELSTLMGVHHYGAFLRNVPNGANLSYGSDWQSEKVKFDKYLLN